MKRKDLFCLFLSVVFAVCIFSACATDTLEKETEKSVTDSYAVQTSTTAGSQKYVEYQDPYNGLSLQIPEGWTVSLNDGTLSVTDPTDKSTKAVFTFINNVTSKINAVGLADLIIEDMSASYSDFVFIPSISGDHDFVELDCSYTDNEAGQKVRANYSVILDNGKGLFSGFETTEAQFQEKKDILEYVLASLNIPGGLTDPTNTDQEAEDPNQSVELFTRTENGTSIDVPAGWTVTAFGSPGNLIALNKEEDSGYIAQTVAIFPEALAAYAGENLVSDYLDPVDFLQQLYLPALGNTDIQLESKYDASALLQGAEGVEAEIVLFCCEGSKGIRQNTLILALTIAPSIITGQWSALVYGFWAPEDRFEESFTLLTRISDSYKPDEEEIKRVTAENWKNYQQGIKELSQSFSDQLENSFQPSENVSSDETMSSEDRLYQKWNDYAAGEERLFSEVEDKVYTLPSGYDKYSDPEYPSEELSQITNEQWNKEVDRSYLPGGWNN